MAKYALDVRQVRGRRLHVSAWVKTHDVKQGWAGIWARADRGDEHPYFDNMQRRGLEGSHEWTRLELVGDIPWDVDRVVFGAILPGKGQMWVDDFEITTSLLGEPIETTGRVTDHAGKPVSGARVSFVHPTRSETVKVATTDARGRYATELPLGTYGVTVVARGKPASIRTDVLVQSPGTVDLKLPPHGGFHFHGQLSGGKGSTQAELRCYLDIGPVGAVFNILPDSSGRFDVDLPRGFYWCQAFGGETQSKGIRINQEEDLEHDFSLTTPEPTPDAVVSWFRDQSLPLLSVEAGHGDADLMPLKKSIGGARVVALGEATHGTREFFQLKHRLLEFLVRRMGFSVFAIEANWPETDALNEYVLSGRGDPRAGLLATKFWTWNTEEVLALVEWMRAWNADPKHTRKLSFYGVDMQFAEDAARKLKAYLERVAPVVAQAESASLAGFIDGQPTGEIALHEARKQGVERLKRALDDHRQDYERSAGKRAWLFARRYAALLEQNLEAGPPGKPDFEVRDRAMAENLKWVIEEAEPGAKAVFWAHNAHIQESKELVPSSGHYLAESLGAKYVSIGFVFGRGGFQAIDFSGSQRGLTAFEVGEPPLGSVDEALSRTGWAISFVDLRNRPTSGVVGAWFQRSHVQREIGSGFSSEASMQQEVKLAERFDAVLFVRSTTRARPLAKAAGGK